MSWYNAIKKIGQQLELFNDSTKTLQEPPKMTIVSWNSYGELKIYLGNKLYTYEGVNPYLINKLQTYISKKNWRSAFLLLKVLSEKSKTKTAQIANNISFKAGPHFDPIKEQIIYINPQKIDKELQRDTDFYVGPNGKGGIKEKYDKFGDFLKKNEAVEMPEFAIGNDGVLGIKQGRHRFAYLRDLKLNNIPIIVPKNQAELIKNKFNA